MEKKFICLHFHIHQPVQFNQYRFFDIGKNHIYADDFTNRFYIEKMAQKCYLPMNNLILELIKKYGKEFKVSFSISGIIIEELLKYAPEVIKSFKKLANTGSVEFLSETYSHSLTSIVDSKEFKKQVEKHNDIMKEVFDIKPKAFVNTDFIYSDEIGDTIAKMGYKTILTEGAKHILGWKSPNFVYANPINPKLKLLLRNFRLSDDISLRFSNKEWSDWPLSAEKYADWLIDSAKNDDVINLFMDYETFGEYQSADSGIFDFMYHLPEHILKSRKLEFVTPSQAASKLQTCAPLHVPYPISGIDEERDTSAWLGNSLQKEAFEELNAISDRVYKTKDETIIKDYNYLQESNHLYYMSTKLFSDGGICHQNSPYSSPYDAFINYMNILSDLIVRLERIESKK